MDPISPALCHSAECRDHYNHYYMERRHHNLPGMLQEHAEMVCMSEGRKYLSL